jgi:hypothetical protein
MTLAVISSGCDLSCFDGDGANSDLRDGASIRHAVTYTLGAGLSSVALLIMGCSPACMMMPIPNVHLDKGRNFYANLETELQDTRVPLFYITDRAPEQSDAARRYRSGGVESATGAHRSPVLEDSARLSRRTTCTIEPASISAGQSADIGPTRLPRITPG